MIPKSVKRFSDKIMRKQSQSLDPSAAPSRASPLGEQRGRDQPAATTAIMMVQIALISGFTPRRTSRIDADRQRGRARARW